MGFRPLASLVDNKELLSNEYKSGTKIGVIVLGDSYFFFRRGFTKYYIAYPELQRCFRRVMLIPYKKGRKNKENIEVEYAVLMNEGKEVAQIQLPGAKAGEELLVKVHEKSPNTLTVCPKKRGKDKIRNY